MLRTLLLTALLLILSARPAQPTQAAPALYRLALPIVTQQAHTCPDGYIYHPQACIQMEPAWPLEAK